MILDREATCPPGSLKSLNVRLRIAIRRVHYEKSIKMWGSSELIDFFDSVVFFWGERVNLPSHRIRKAFTFSSQMVVKRHILIPQYGTAWNRAGVRGGGGCWKEDGHWPPAHSCMHPPILKVGPSNPSHKPPSRGPPMSLTFLVADAASHAFPLPLSVLSLLVLISTE